MSDVFAPTRRPSAAPTAAAEPQRHVARVKMIIPGHCVVVMDNGDVVLGVIRAGDVRMNPTERDELGRPKYDVDWSVESLRLEPHHQQGGAPKKED